MLQISYNFVNYTSEELEKTTKKKGGGEQTKKGVFVKVGEE